MQLSHLDVNGNAKMIAVDDKQITHRTAQASGIITMQATTLALIKNGGVKKGDVLTVAKLAGINAAKHTWEFIPLCHNLLLEACDIEFEYKSDTQLQVRATVAATAKTGVEMEAITAVAIALTTVYDMAKAVDRAMVIGEIHLLEKCGGKCDYIEQKNQYNSNII